MDWPPSGLAGCTVPLTSSTPSTASADPSTSASRRSPRGSPRSWTPTTSRPRPPTTRACGAARSIVATARSQATRRRVAELGLADEVAATNGAAVKDADLVIVCVPVGQCGAVAAEIGPHLREGAIVSDVGSVKAQVARDMAPHLPAGIHFVPAHPVAGTEYSGPDAGFAELFVNRWCILTPPEHADPAAVERLSAFWQALGSSVETMSAEHHDLVLAITSHVPHLIAYTIVGTADDLEM